MDAGILDRRVTFSRRPRVEGDVNARGDDYSDRYLTVWASYRRLSGAQKLQAGALVDDEIGTLSIRNSSQAREVTASDRVTIQGRDFAIQTVGLPDRASNLIPMTVSSQLGD